MLERFMPSRSNAKESAQVVTDLDKMVSQPVAFQWNGKKHLIKPIDLKAFLQATEAMSRAESLKNSSNIDDALDIYFDIISSCCESVSRDDMNKMTIAQIGALLNLVLSTITGKENIKKKTQ